MYMKMQINKSKRTALQQRKKKKKKALQTYEAKMRKPTFLIFLQR